VGTFLVHNDTIWVKNAPVVFSRVVVATFKDFIQNFLEVYLDDWTMFSLLK
jgi:hypothetical protein